MSGSEIDSAGGSVVASWKTLSKRIRNRRLRSGLSQKEVAEKLQVTAPTVSNWERGQTKPNNEQLLELRKVIGTIHIPSELKSAGDKKANRVEDEDSDVDASESASSTPLGVWLNRERVRNGFTVAQLSDKASVSEPTIYGIESGSIRNPREKTVKKLTKALKVAVPADVAEDTQDDASIEGLGELVDFNPSAEDEIPTDGGVYVFYDVSDRPVYVGQASNIRSRIKQHKDKFWFRPPIVNNAAYVAIPDKGTRSRIERILIKFLKSNAVLNVRLVDR